MQIYDKLLLLEHEWTCLLATVTVLEWPCAKPEIFLFTGRLNISIISTMAKGVKFTKEEELLLQDFSRNISKKASLVFYCNAFIASAIPICECLVIRLHWSRPKDQRDRFNNVYQLLELICFYFIPWDSHLVEQYSMRFSRILPDIVTLMCTLFSVSVF